jgi:hypothetical protein
MFNNTRLGHWRLLHRRYLDVLGLSFSNTFTDIILVRKFPLWNIYLSRPGIFDARARYRAAARRLGNAGLYNSTFLQLSTYITHASILVSNNYSKVWGQEGDGPVVWHPHSSNLQLHCFQFGSTRLAVLIVTSSARFGSAWSAVWMSPNNWSEEWIHSLDSTGVAFYTQCRERQCYAVLGKNSQYVGATSGMFKVLLFSMEEVIFSCIGGWYLGFIQQGNKQVYNYSFEECFNRFNKY